MRRETGKKDQKEENVKYTIRTVNDWTKPYDWTAGDRRMITERQTDETATGDSDLAVILVKDWLDVPAGELTDEDVHRDFDVNRAEPVKQKFVDAIKAYYNGRLKIFEKFKKDFERELSSGKKQFILKYDIPYEMNHFETEDDDGWAASEKQNEAYIEIEVES